MNWKLRIDHHAGNPTANPVVTTVTYQEVKKHTESNGDGFIVLVCTRHQLIIYSLAVLRKRLNSMKRKLA